MRSKAIRAERAELLTNTRKAFDAIAGRAPSDEENAAFDAGMARVESLTAQADRMDAAERAEALMAESHGVTAEVRGQSVDQVLHTYAAEKRIITALLSGRSDHLPEAERAIVAARRAGYQAVASTGTTTAGGYTIAPEFMRELLIAMKAQGGMRAIARTISTETGAALPWPTMDDRAQVATIIQENSQITPDTDLTFGSNSLGAYTYKSGVLLVSLQLLQDSAFDFDGLIKNAMVGRFVRGQNAHFTNGTGTNQPQGVLTAAPVGWTAPVGSTTSITFDDVLELIHSVDPVYRPGSAFMFHDQSLKGLRKLKDAEGRYLWQAMNDGTAGAPLKDYVWGYPTVINQDMPVMGAGAVSMAFGDFSNYVIRDVLGMQMMVLRERYAEYLQVGYISYMRTDGRLISAASPIKTLKNSAT